MSQEEKKKKKDRKKFAPLGHIVNFRLFKLPLQPRKIANSE